MTCTDATSKQLIQEAHRIICYSVRG